MHTLADAYSERRDAVDADLADLRYTRECSAIEASRLGRRGRCHFARRCLLSPIANEAVLNRLYIQSGT